MLNLPRTPTQWVVAVISALVGFFFGGAAIALAQVLLKRLFGIGG